MTTPIVFKRALFSFDVASSSALALDVAARFAELLRLDLMGLFIVDETLQAAAAYPGAREFLAGQGSWRAIDPTQLQHELESAVKGAERLFTSKATARQVVSSFRVLRGKTDDTLRTLAMTNDILIVTEPNRATAFLTQTASLVMDAAIQSSASVLLIPATARVQGGPVMAIAASNDDPSVDVAALIAAAAGERLIITEMFDRGVEDGVPRSDPHVSSVSRVRAGEALEKDPGLLFGLIGRPTESLIVYTRRLNDFGMDFPLLLAKQRNVPLLILEPPPQSHDQPS